MMESPYNCTMNRQTEQPIPGVYPLTYDTRNKYKNTVVFSIERNAESGSMRYFVSEKFRPEAACDWLNDCLKLLLIGSGLQT